MKSWRSLRSILLHAGLILACVTRLPVLGQSLPYAQDHLLVRFKPKAVPGLDGLSAPAALATLAAGLRLPAGARLEESALGRLLRESTAGRATVNSAGAPPLDLNRFFYVYLPPGLSVARGVEQLQGHPWVAYAEPDGVATGGATPIIPNDPIFPQQWHHTNSVKPGADIHTPLAWSITRGASNVLVAVLDTGLAPDLPETYGRVVSGYNFAYGTADTSDDEGHGTAVTTILAANTDNGILGAGVDWHCQLLPVKVLDGTNSGLYSWFAQGIDYAVSRGAKVINLSAGGFEDDNTLTLSISNAIAQGRIFVTITHNDATNQIRFPGRLPMCITVGATDQNDQRAPFSNYGPQIDLVAPGTNIFTAGMGGGEDVWGGTSMAAPLVSGVCSLMAALRPGLTQDQARALVCAGADDRVGDATDTPGFDVYYGWGRLNAYNALLLAQTRVDRTFFVPGAGLVLSWASPPNAGDRRPYRVAMAPSLTATWSVLTNNTGFTYTPTRTYWTNSSPAAVASFYRVQIFQP